MVDPLRSSDGDDELAETAMRQAKNYTPVSEDFAAEARDQDSQRALRLAHHNAKWRSAESCGYLAENSSQFLFRTKQEFQRAVQERPLQLLGLIAAVAFVAGVAVRIWRSNS